MPKSIQVRWILPVVIVLGSLAYLFATKNQVPTEAILETQKKASEFKGSFFYELNMEGEVPLTSNCAQLDDQAAANYSAYSCTESDDKVLSDWSCVKPTTTDSPSRQFIEVILGDLALCQKKLEDFRDRFQ
jgi:hypothetical protein